MTRDGLTTVVRMLTEVDDIIYRDARSRGGSDFPYTEDETKISEIIDEARGQAEGMLEAAK